MASLLSEATQAVNSICVPPFHALMVDGALGSLPTGASGAAATASNVANAASTVAAVANDAANTVLDVKAAWSSPENCLHSKYLI